MRDSDTSNVTDLLLRDDDIAALPVLDPAVLDEAASRAAEEFLADGTPANTVRSYASALRYWAAWYALRYGRRLQSPPLPPAVVAQFVIDHLERRSKGELRQELPPAIDARLVACGAKARPGPLKYATVSHRLAVLAKWHRLRGGESPTDDPKVKTLLARARKAQARRGVTVRKKTALVAEPLQALLATCTDGLRGVRDRALLLLAWSGGGRRRSEVVALDVGDLRRIDDETWVYALGATKTDATGRRREKPLRGPVVGALRTWLEQTGIEEGPLFRRLHRGNHLGRRLGEDQVARIVQRRAALAGLEGDWAAHSLRSGFVTEAGRQGVPLGEVMEMTEHRSMGTVLGYFQAGTLLSSRASTLLRVTPSPSSGGAGNAPGQTDAD